MSGFLSKRRFFRSFLALVLLAATWAVSLHFHAKEDASAGTRETCSVCVAGHQLKSGAAASLDRAETVAWLSVSSSSPNPSQPERLFFPSHSSRAPPAV